MRALVVGLALVAVACSSTAKTKPPAATTAPTTKATTTTAAPAVSALTVQGVSPGVEQAPFYPQITVSSVTCGPTAGGRYVALTLPAGGPGAPAGSVMTEATVAFIVPGKAVVEDFARKVDYEQDSGNITTARRGTFVLSLTNVTFSSGDNKSVPVGAINIEGDYTCPATDVPLTGR